MKKILWNERHSDYLKEQERKSKVKQEAEARRKNQKGIMSQVSEVSQSGMTPAELATSRCGDVVSEASSLSISDQKSDPEKS